MNLILNNISDTTFNLIIASLYREHWNSSWYANEDENGQGESLYDSSKFVIEEDISEKQWGLVHVMHPVKMEFRSKSTIFQWECVQHSEPTTAKADGRMLIVGVNAEQLELIKKAIPYHNFGYYPEKEREFTETTKIEKLF